LTAFAVCRSAYAAALAGTVDLAATAILDDLVTFPLAVRALGFRTAVPILLPVMMVMVMVGVRASTVTATADDGPVAGGASFDCQCGDWSDGAEHGGERADQTAQGQPARGGRGQRYRESVEAIRVHPRSRAAHAVRRRYGKKHSIHVSRDFLGAE